MRHVDPRLIQQRTRNRIYEYLGGVAEFPTNRGAWDLGDVVHEWEMYVDDPFMATNFPAPSFTLEEVAELAAVHSAWKAFADVAADVAEEDRCMKFAEWDALVAACAKAEALFAARGRLPEETLVENDA